VGERRSREHFFFAKKNHPRPLDEVVEGSRRKRIGS